MGYVDFYDLQTWLIAISILGLSLLDAILTGIQVVSGRTQEVNPIMSAVMNRGGLYTFFSVKAAMTAFPLAILVLHKEWPLARFTVRLCLWSYILVAIYHFYLVFGCPV